MTKNTDATKTHVTKTVVVTGATGMIGRPLCKALLERGYAVTVFSRDPEAAKVKVPGATSYVAWDANGMGAWKAALKGAYGVVNLAGESLFNGYLTEEQLKAASESRVIGTRHLVTAMEKLEHRPKVLVNASSTGIYGFTEISEETVTENTPPPRQDLWSSDSERWEVEAYRAESFGVRTVALRIGVALGQEEGALPYQVQQFRAGRGSYSAPGTQGFAWIHLEDVVDLFIFALEMSEVHGPINATAPELVSNREYAQTLARVLSTRADYELPAETLRQYIGFAADVTTYMRRVLPQRALDLGYPFKFPELEPALHDLLA